MERLLTPEQAGELLQVSTRTVYEWLRQGHLPGTQFGDRTWRIRESQVLTTDARALLEEGLMCSARGWVEEGAKAFRRALEMNPRYNLANFHLGYMYYRWHRYQQAEEPLKRAIQLHPEWWEPYGVLGLNYNYWGLYSRAEPPLRKAVELAPGNPDCCYQLGVALGGQFDGDKDREAISWFQKAIDLDPQSPRNYLFLPALLFKVGDISAARSLYLRLKELCENTEEAENRQAIEKIAERLSLRIEYAKKYGPDAAANPLFNPGFEF